MQSTATTASERAAEAFDQFGNSILRLAFSYLQNFQDAEDVLQETILQLIKTKPTFEDSEHMKA